MHTYNNTVDNGETQSQEKEKQALHFARLFFCLYFGLRREKSKNLNFSSLWRLSVNWNWLLLER